jgi:ribose transport system permease protein
VTTLTARIKLIEPSSYVVYVGFLVIFIIFAIVLRDVGFLAPRNLLNIVQQTAPITVMAVATVFVFTAGEIDLSIGSVVANAALIAAIVMQAYPWQLAVVAGLSVGLAIGVLNGTLVAYLKLPSFLVTLANMGLFAGTARWLTDLRSIPVSNTTFTGLFGSGSVFGIPSLVIWSAGAVAVGHYVFRSTRFGAHVHAVGDSPAAASAAGIRVPHIRFSVLVLSGTCAGLAGLLYAGRLYAARYTFGELDLLTVIAAVIVGGTRLNGGVGTVLGALIGSLMMGMLNNGLILIGLDVSQQMIVRGLIILGTVALTLRDPSR